MAEDAAAIDELLPHAPPMRLIDAILAHEPPHLSCRAVLGQDSPLVSEGQATPWIALELIAQCAAVAAGLEARSGGERLATAALVAVRELRLHAPGVPVGTVLRVETTRLGGALAGAAFTGRVCAPGGALLAEGTITVAGGVAPRRAGGSR